MPFGFIAFFIGFIVDIKCFIVSFMMSGVESFLPAHVSFFSLRLVISVGRLGGFIN